MSLVIYLLRICLTLTYYAPFQLALKIWYWKIFCAILLINKIGTDRRKEMHKVVENVKPEFIVNKKGNKKAVILSLKEYENILELLEDFEDANDLLRAEREATSFIPYDNFRKTWLKN
jgi:PHD/YefM family antitoxin component YafN of YafNO toxin-antitoxin module